MTLNRSILHLPQELILQISSYLRTIDLGNLRRSCKTIEKYLFQTFAAEYFTKRQFMIEHESLEALLGISRHPSLSRSLRDVIFDVRVFNPMVMEVLEELTEIRYDSGCFPRDQLLCTGRALTMLVDAFQKLSRLRSVGVRNYSALDGTRDDESSYSNLWGWLRPDGWVGRVLESPTNADYILPLIIEALAAARVQLERLEIKLAGRLKLGSDAFTIPDEAHINCMLGQLKTVTLSMSTTATRPRIRRDGDEESKSFLILHLIPLLRFLYRLRSVEFLRLNFGHESSADAILLDWIMGAQLVVSGKTRVNQPVPTPRFERLVTLELGSLAVWFEQLLRVLTHFRLQSFALWRVAFFSNASKGQSIWPSFLLDLSRKLPRSSNIDRIIICDVIEINYGLFDVVWGTTHPWANRRSGCRHTKKIDYDRRGLSHTACDWLAAISTLATLRARLRNPRLDLKEDDMLSDNERTMRLERADQKV